MHNEEGKLFDAVFHKLLSLGVALIAAAAVVWFIWATARTCAITREASPPEMPADANSMLRQAPGETASADAMIKLFLRPMARAAGRVDRLPRSLAETTADAVFFAAGPS